jgi:hypothetical protein
MSSCAFSSSIYCLPGVRRVPIKRPPSGCQMTVDRTCSIHLVDVKQGFHTPCTSRARAHRITDLGWLLHRSFPDRVQRIIAFRPYTRPHGYAGLNPHPIPASAAAAMVSGSLVIPARSANSIDSVRIVTSLPASRIAFWHRSIIACARSSRPSSKRYLVRHSAQMS